MVRIFIIFSVVVLFLGLVAAYFYSNFGRSVAKKVNRGRKVSANEDLRPDELKNLIG